MPIYIYTEISQKNFVRIENPCQLSYNKNKKKCEEATNQVRVNAFCNSYWYYLLSIASPMKMLNDSHRFFVE